MNGEALLSFVRVHMDMLKQPGYYLNMEHMWTIKIRFSILFNTFTCNPTEGLQHSQSALHRASYAGKTECVEVLLKYGAQVDLPVRCDVM